MRRFVIILLALAVLAASLCGCTSAEKTGITRHFGKTEVTGARLYVKDGDEYKIEELGADKLGELAKALDALTYKTYGFHTDYFWGGRYGLELSLSDGTYWTYDGTCLQHLKASVTEDPTMEQRLDKTFADITEGEFWQTVTPFFEGSELLWLIG